MWHKLLLPKRYSSSSTSLPTREVLNLDSSWCALQKSEELYSTRSTDLDHIERLVQCLGKYHINKRGDVKDSKI